MIRWILYLPLALFFTVLGHILAPLVALCVTRRLHMTTVKRLDKRKVIIARDFIIKPLYWFQTFDNAADEYWYGKYNEDAPWPFHFLRGKTQAEYDESRWIRYCCRLLWLERNCAYGFMQFLLGRPGGDWELFHEKGKEDAGYWRLLTKRRYSFQLEMHVPLGFGYYNSVNIGWKPHKGFDRVMYAHRFIGLRSYDK